ncbi:D-2-hydroxyacid dehydrogenase [Lipingzhangella sp. LS1_29]|uniref:D-2-hydroxyacid dehydrogenase n=1 Tax=Lipingzhangella rawalii TaxID=2055835 RepID=A0ABU2H904_9ACTN|nr:D-2-hydroxyacid dehydrogenase [Lipingzhangella rawalii]MDS1271776.1 D-2-hydroxyacid dehydrogenase [Lipingzhangella rawalii]
MPTPPGRPNLVVLHAGQTPPGIDPVDRDPRLASVRYATAEELPEVLPGAEALFVWDLFSEALTHAWEKADALRWIHAATAGVNHLMFPAAVRSDVTITNSRGVFDQPMAEYVLGLVLAFAKDLGTTLDLQRRREWRHRETERLTGRSALVAGTGPIGRAIARQLTAAGLHVTGLGRVARAEDSDFGQIVAASDLHAVLPTADYVILAAPLTETTRGMVDATALHRMQPTARLINVGRGDLVVQDDLIAALRTNTIAGAALDVFAEEPLPEDSPLWQLPNVIVSPHMSGDVIGWREELVRLFLDNLDHFLDGRELRNVVDKQRGYVSGA